MLSCTFVPILKQLYMNSTERSSKLVAAWLLIGVGMTVIQIALGGITRLTGSGLSITQWDVITGSLPPLNEQQWLAEFDKYRHTPQYHLLNFDFTLSDFKFIFFWEWFHRLWARTIGLVFMVGFVWLLVKRHFKKEFQSFKTKKHVSVQLQLKMILRNAEKNLKRHIKL